MRWARRSARPSPPVLVGRAGLALAEQLVEGRVEVGALGGAEAFDVAERVVEVGAGGGDVGVTPSGVATVRTVLGFEGGPEVGGVAQPAGAQLEADEARE